MAKILSIQSTVLNDLVGNQAARSILKPLKHNLIEVPTIILTSHKGQKSSLQIHSNDLNISDLNKKDMNFLDFEKLQKTLEDFSKN